MTPFTLKGPTDKMEGGWHQHYLRAYARLLASLEDSPHSVLEIGTDGGAPLIAYRDWFHCAQVIGIDVNPTPGCLSGQERITHYQRDAYTPETLELLKQHAPFAAIIDDGSHFPHHQDFFCTHYPHLLAPDGMLICEDVPDYSHVPRLIGKLPPEFMGFAVDLRFADDRFDSVLLCVIRR